MGEIRANILFPEAVDDRIYFQNLQATEVPINNEFLELLDASSYSEAVQTLNDNAVNYYGANLFNHLENRLVAIEDFIINKETGQVFKFQYEKPDNVQMWLSQFNVDMYNYLKNLAMQMQYFYSSVDTSYFVVRLGDDRQANDSWNLYEFNKLEEVIYSLAEYLPESKKPQSEAYVYFTNEFPTYADFERLNTILANVSRKVYAEMYKVWGTGFHLGQRTFIQV